jgi:hypothetical protein
LEAGVAGPRSGRKVFSPSIIFFFSRKGWIEFCLDNLTLV